MGSRPTGRRCLLVARVNGFNLVPRPPARTTPLIRATTFQGGGGGGWGEVDGISRRFAAGYRGPRLLFLWWRRGRSHSNPGGSAGSLNGNARGRYIGARSDGSPPL